MPHTGVLFVRSAAVWHQSNTLRCPVRLYGGFRCRGHTWRVSSKCVAQQNGSQQSLYGGQAGVQDRMQALSQVELLMQRGSRMTAVAQAVWAGFVRQGDVAVDATCGNGHDSKWLAEAVGPQGKLYAFDIQHDAIRSTKAVLEDEVDPAQLPRLSLIEGCHSHMKEHVKEQAQLVCFNLGFLPGGERELITKPGTTIAAIQAALDIVQPSGLVSVLAYTGHPGGREEYEAVRQLGSEQLPENFTVFEQRILSRPNAPVLLLFWKRPANE